MASERAAGHWYRGYKRRQTESTANRVMVQGIPFDGNSSYLPGPAKAPARIYEALFQSSTNIWTELGVDLGDRDDWQILPDLVIDGGQEQLAASIERVYGELLADRQKVITVGGDHSVSYPVLQQYSAAYAELTVLQLDAHPDLYEELDGNRHSHACPFARLLESCDNVRLVQAGIRAATGHQRAQASRYGVEMIEMLAPGRLFDLSFAGPVYLSLDLDCLDPAYAPGVSHHEPGGLTTREVLRIVHWLAPQLVGADIVEYNPDRDQQGMTAMVAAKLLKELVGALLS